MFTFINIRRLHCRTG